MSIDKAVQIKIVRQVQVSPEWHQAPAEARRKASARTKALVTNFYLKTDQVDVQTAILNAVKSAGLNVDDLNGQSGSVVFAIDNGKVNITQFRVKVPMSRTSLKVTPELVSKLADAYGLPAGKIATLPRAAIRAMLANLGT